MAHLSAALMAVLRCPVTGSPLVQEGDELVSTGRDAAGRQLRYHLDEGIPVLLPPAQDGTADGHPAPDRTGTNIPGNTSVTNNSPADGS